MYLCRDMRLNGVYMSEKTAYSGLRSKPIITAEILCVGTELLLGDIVNTNASFLAKQLASLGISVYHQSVVGDHAERLTAALQDAFSGHGRPAADLVILSGGLGPTYDDMTKETVAAFFGRKMYCHEPSLAAIKEYFERTGRVMSENNRKQAMMPEGAVVLPNPYGTAPGLAVGDDTRTAILLPGPPSELIPMFETQVRPLINPFCENVLVSRNLHIMGLGESDVESRLKDLMISSGNPTIAPYCGNGEVRLRITAKAPSEAEAAQMCDHLIEKVTSTSVGDYIYGIDIPNPETALLSRLKDLGLTLATAESCTGGLMGQRITGVPGASAVFLGGFMTYCNQVKVDVLGVSQKSIDQFTEVSAAVAEEMAAGARRALACDVAISATGYAGPGGGTEENPVGTVYVGIATPKGTSSFRLYYRNKSRNYIREAVASRAFIATLEAVKNM
ncbi:MAG: competence/damage-inducible protein A [Ruminococcaceae bacterium]|nr:competence/damage-inducible protein A [Oscillospiraceae bacterium]